MTTASALAASAAGQPATVTRGAIAGGAAGILVASARAAGPYEAIGLAAILGLLGAIASIDLRERRAPNVLVYPAIALAIAWAAPIGLAPFVSAMSGSAIVFTIFLVVAVFGRGAFGLGDVKCGAAYGALTGASAALPFIALTFVGGGILAAALLVLGRRSRKDSLPFTPFMLAGAVVTLLVYSFPLGGS